MAQVSKASLLINDLGKNHDFSYRTVESNATIISDVKNEIKDFKEIPRLP